MLIEICCRDLNANNPFPTAVPTNLNDVMLTPAVASCVLLEVVKSLTEDSSSALDYNKQTLQTIGQTLILLKRNILATLDINAILAIPVVNVNILKTLRLLVLKASSYEETDKLMLQTCYQTNILNLIVGLLCSAEKFDSANTSSYALITAASNFLETIISKSTKDPTYYTILAQLVTLYDSKGFLINVYNNVKEGYDSSGDANVCLVSICLLGITVAECGIGVCCLKSGVSVIEDTNFYDDFVLQVVQKCPNNGVRCECLNVWLDLQDEAVEERRPRYGKVFYMKVLECIVEGLKYNKEFESWEECIELDKSEFDEFRSLSSEVLQQCYSLLRLDFLNVLRSEMKGEWQNVEGALYALEEVSTGVCARVKSMGPSTKADREGTVAVLRDLLDLVVTNQSTLHPVMLASTCRFLGSYAPFINSHCSPESIVRVLEYLKASFSGSPSTRLEAGKSIRGIFLNCTKQLAKVEGFTTLLNSCISVSLETNERGAILAVAEGGTRACVQIGGQSCNVGLGSLCTPVLKYLEQFFVAVKAAEASNDVGLAEASKRTLSTGLATLAVIVKYLDGLTVNGNGAHPFAELLNVCWPMLQSIASYDPCRLHPDILQELLGVHGKIVSSFGDIIEPKLGELINIVVQAYEEGYNRGCLDFVAVAAEKFGNRGGGVEESFRGLLAHLTAKTCQHIQSVGMAECTELVTSFFDLAQRFLLFCPTALVKNEQFPLIYSFGVVCLVQCKGERDSTRQALIFLTQVIGRKGVRLSQSTRAALEECRSTIDAHTAQHGSEIVKSCFVSLAGGSPQMLLPAFSDCLYAIVTHVIGADSEEGGKVDGGGGGLVQTWIVSALNDEAIPKFIEDSDKANMMQAMFNIATKGLKEKGRFKSLIGDFVKICKREVNGDVLASYS
ncbi:hypothetical protein TL16_g13076 [Triparma laevis f. inornata]|uniref:Uncharacterized protein n=1 Tax=Triparma laevis f. inornata TaxID=1714386 RepID=A0A9W7BWN4_9STRA|nr:hypothetical protein TL16_g13076 [Triparma laevis f. inornata]